MSDPAYVLIQRSVFDDYEVWRQSEYETDVYSELVAQFQDRSQALAYLKWRRGEDA